MTSPSCRPALPRIDEPVINSRALLTYVSE